jgi:hypothetical protein
MSNEDKFWVTVWCIPAVCFITLVVCITATLWSKRQHLNEMVTKGADPIRAACALDMYDNQTVCVIHNVLQPNKE